MLGEIEDTSTSVANLPTNEDIAAKVFGTEIDKQISVYINKMCATAWVDRSGQYNSFLGYVTDKQQDGYLVDHLQRVNSGSHRTWAYPSKEDVDLSKPDQILPCEIVGEWNLRDPRNTLFALKNVKDVINLSTNLPKK